MANSIKTDFHSELATNILSDIQYKRSNYFYFLGKIEKWNADDIPPAAVPLETHAEITGIRSNILYINRIMGADVSIVTKRHNWVSGVVYTEWDDAVLLKDTNFYCVTSDHNVYKCLSNNNGVTSTIKPVSTDYYSFKTADGYVWKYMYNIPSFKWSKFSSGGYIPVQRALTDTFYNKGSVDDVVITNAGVGYLDTIKTHIVVVSNDTGAGAILVPTVTKTAVLANDGITVVRPAGTIISVKIVNAGTNYLVAPTLTVSDEFATGSGLYGNVTAKLTAVVFEGKIVNVTIEDPGQNYSAELNTSITVQGDGTGAVFTPVVYNGSLIDVVVENGGTGYSSMILTVIGAGSTVATLNPVLATSDFVSDQAIIEQSTIAGEIYNIKVLTGGSDYSSNSTVEVTGDGTGCIAQLVIAAGEITAINVVSYGLGYTYANIVISDLVGIGGTARAVISPMTGHGRDAVAELFGDTIVLNSVLRKDALLNTLTQDYRQFGILKNPTDLVTGHTFGGTSSLVTFDVQFNDASDLAISLAAGNEEIINFENNRFLVVNVTGNIVTLQQLGTGYVIPLGECHSEFDNTIYSMEKIISRPVVNKYSGKLLYSADEGPFVITADQGIVIKTFLNF